MKLRKSFGANGALHSSLAFVKEGIIVYVSGNLVVIHDIETSTQSFIEPSTHCERVTGVTINEKKTLIAVAEKRWEYSPAVFTYLVAKLKRRKIIFQAENEPVTATVPRLIFDSNVLFKSIVFSEDGEHLLAISDSPDMISHEPLLIIWALNSGKVINHTKLITASSHPNGLNNQAAQSTRKHVPGEFSIYEASFSPVPFTVKQSSKSVVKRKEESNTRKRASVPISLAQHILVIGRNVLKLFKFHENSLKACTIYNKKQMNVAEIKSFNFISQCWLNIELFVVGTAFGDVLLFRDNELLGTISNSTLNEEVASGIGVMSLVPISVQGEGNGEELLPSFVMGSDAIKVYEARETDDIKKITNSSFVCTRRVQLRSERYDTSEIDVLGKAKVCAFALAPESDILVFWLSTNEIYSFNLSNVGVLQSEQPTFDLITSFHGPYQVSQNIVSNVKTSEIPSTSASSKSVDSSGSLQSLNEHKCRITGLASCQRRCIILTCGLDNSIRVTDIKPLLGHDMSSAMFFKESPLSVSLHPLGFICMIGFVSKLKMFDIASNNFLLLHQVPIKQCKVVKFSSDGQYFGAVNNQIRVVQIFRTFSFENISNLKGHISAVNDFCFLRYDKNVATAGKDGKVIYFDIVTGERLRTISEQMGIQIIQVKSVTPDKGLEKHVFESVCIYLTNESDFQNQMKVADLQSSAGVSASSSKYAELFQAMTTTFTKNVKEIAGVNNISITNLEVCTVSIPKTKKDVAAGNVYSTQISVLIQRLSKYGRSLPTQLFTMIFHFDIAKDGTSKLQENYSVFTDEAQSGPVPFLLMRNINWDTTQSNFVTASDDGSLIIREFAPNEVSTVQVSSVEPVVSPWFLETLVHNDYLSRLIEDLQNQQDCLEEVSEHNDFLLRQDVSSFEAEANELRLIHEERVAKLEKLTTSLKAEIEFVHKEREIIFVDTENKEKSELSKIEKAFIRRNEHELKKQEKLEKDSEEIILNWELQKVRNEKEHEDQLQNLVTSYEQKVTKCVEESMTLNKEKDKLNKDHSMLQTAMEESGDSELFKLRKEYEDKLNLEKQITAGHLKSNVENKETLETLIEKENELKNTIEQLKKKENDLHDKIKSLQKDKGSHRKEIREREDTIEEKDALIFELKKKNQELEKFRFVLDYKIKELQREIEPQQIAIAEKKQQIFEMDKELKCYQSNNFNLDLMVTELKLKIHGMENNIEKQAKINNALQRYSKQYTYDLELLLVSYEETRNIGSIKKGIIRLNGLYLMRKKTDKENNSQMNYSEKQDDTNTGKADTEEEDDMLRQRDFFERNIQSLERKILKAREKFASEQRRLLGEEKELLKELHTVQTDLSLLESKAT